MEELEVILADTTNEELTTEKKEQYNNVSYTDLCNSIMITLKQHSVIGLQHPCIIYAKTDYF